MFQKLTIKIHSNLSYLPEKHHPLTETIGICHRQPWHRGACSRLGSSWAAPRVACPAVVTESVWKNSLSKSTYNKDRRHLL